MHQFNRRVAQDPHCQPSSPSWSSLPLRRLRGKGGSSAGLNMRLRSTNALEPLCGVLAIASLSLIAQGPEVVTEGKRRWVDAHGLRG
jgi:hypothetical protein